MKGRDGTRFNTEFLRCRSKSPKSRTTSYRALLLHMKPEKPLKAHRLLKGPYRGTCLNSTVGTVQANSGANFGQECLRESEKNQVIATWESFGIAVPLLATGRHKDDEQITGAFITDPV